ncbi:Na+/H+ antiporter NhaC family protein [Peptoniphilus sp.]|jgi:NhaC family Na+:H+ antiporter|uniref:Na+/H+ antiporter NhaC family protein n=1 Tax=Peptoniphilus sp. TaxID=1971214 RepID=UPI003D8A9B86
MLENITLILFISILLINVFIGAPIYIALIINLILLCLYARRKNYTKKEILDMIIVGIKDIKMILIVFTLIGMITGIWRLSGTLSYIIYYGVSFIKKEFFYVGIFLFNTAVSFLTGTSFGTASTAGIISMSIAKAMGFNPIISGGAIVSGCFFGDRSSPLSTSALLVATLTKTDLIENLKNMFKTALVPFILTIITYQLFNLNVDININTDSINSIAEIYNFTWILLLPTIMIIVFSIMKIPLIITLISSIAMSIILAVTVQGSGAGEIINSLIFGFKTNSLAGELLNGGGLLSMIKLHIIVGISSGYFGFFKETAILDPIRLYVNKLFQKFSPMLIMVLLSTVISTFSSNQTLSVMLTYEMARKNIEDEYELALYLENSAILTPAYIPWNIAGRTPIEMIGAPIASLAACFYLHYVILVNTITNSIKYRKNKA